MSKENNQKEDSFDLSYDFFVEKEKSNQEFTLAELCQFTGWKISTPQAYRSKKWKPYLVGGKIRGSYSTDGISQLTKEEYKRMMSQNDSSSNDPLRPPLSVEVESLVVKAREAALHALDSYNRPKTLFRSEGFTVMMVIAWRNLFHAIFEGRGEDYYYHEDDGSYKMVDGQKRAWGLSDCARVFYGDSTNATRSNIEFMIGFRNLVEHRFVPAIDPHMGSKCQACIFNFDEMLVEKFGSYFALSEAVSPPLLTGNLRSPEYVDALKRYQGQHYDDLKSYIDAFDADLPEAIAQDIRYSFRVFLIPKVGNHENSADVALEFVRLDSKNHTELESLNRAIVAIREKQVPVANAGMLKPSMVVKLVTEKLGKDFNLHLHTQAWKMYQARQSGQNAEGCNLKWCHFNPVHNDYLYTQKWVGHLVSKLSDEKEYERLKQFKG